MVHPVELPPQTLYGYCLGDVWLRIVECLVELLYVVASLMFVVGSFCFLPDKDEDLGIGLYIAGSLIFSVLSGYYVVDNICMRVRLIRTVAVAEIMEQWLYFA